MHRETRRIAHFFTKYDVFFLHRPQLFLQFKFWTSKLPKKDRLQIKILKRLPMEALINKALDVMASKAIRATPNTMMFNQTGQSVNTSTSLLE